MDNERETRLGSDNAGGLGVRSYARAGLLIDELKKITKKAEERIEELYHELDPVKPEMPTDNPQEIEYIANTKVFVCQFSNYVEHTRSRYDTFNVTCSEGIECKALNTQGYFFNHSSVVMPEWESTIFRDIIVCTKQLGCDTTEETLEKVIEIVSLIIEKNRKYGNSCFKTPASGDTIIGAMVNRMSDKVNRYQTMIRLSIDDAESVEDTVIDYIGYCVNLWIQCYRVKLSEGVYDYGK